MMPFVSFAQNFEDVLLWRVLKQVEAGFYIDVGAWDPDAHSVTRAFSERGWRGVNIEPLPKCHAKLMRRRPLDVNLSVALGAKPGSATLYDVVGTGLSTLDPDLAASHRASGFCVIERQVKVATLADVCRTYAPADVHFLKVDCEGSEAAVFEGADFSVCRPWIILAEATLPNSQIAAHQAWEQLLLDAGYRFAWFDGLNRFYVATERADEMLAQLALPPNVFDSFIKAPAAELSSTLRDVLDPAPQLSEDDRIALAQRCRDCDELPKVADAGRIQFEADGSRVQIMHNGLKVAADAYCGVWDDAADRREPGAP